MVMALGILAEAKGRATAGSYAMALDGQALADGILAERETSPDASPDEGGNRTVID